MDYDEDNAIRHDDLGLDGQADQEDIQALLDLGYDQLDGFREWVEQIIGLGARVSEQDCYNAEFLIDYLANHQRKTVADMNEFELRWFVFSHYIRKAMADEETENRLPESLERFFGYLRSEQQELAPNWLRGVLDDTAFYFKRKREYAGLDSQDERAWEIGFQAWCAELEEDLDTRVLWLPRELANGIQWADVQGWREATLYAEANQQWQVERERLLSLGMDYESIRGYLMDAYLSWMHTPQARLEEQTPLEVIIAEREERAEQAEGSEGDGQTDSEEENDDSSRY